MAFDNGAVFQSLQVGRTVPDVLARTNWKEKKKGELKITIIVEK